MGAPSVVPLPGQMLCGCDCHYPYNVGGVDYSARAQDDPCGRCSNAHEVSRKEAMRKSEKE